MGVLGKWTWPLTGMLVYLCATGLAREASFMRGMTVSCQGAGRIWGTDLFAGELDRLKEMGINSITIHPYARIHGDGTVSWRRWDPANPPEYIVRPIREAHQRGMRIMIKPHLAYWGSPFSWRGAIKFEDPEAKRRFYTTYKQWVVALALITRDADLFVVGTELKHKIADNANWREIIEAVRKVSPALLTYAANWDTFDLVPFWDALDFIGIQGYFPVTDRVDPDETALLTGWQQILSRLKAVNRATHRPVIYTEFGYNKSLTTAARPWEYRQDHQEKAEALQARCLEVGLRVLEKECKWFYGAFLWKWFAGPAPHANFHLDTPILRSVIERTWKK